ncbi:MAG: ABC-type transport auxiliary lipoprotein family protein [Humidesulfovibrio sp.]|nr:ABC-type transport auxiliary lipoprotein family protein [Humidesulfovibrio sp.]
MRIAAIISLCLALLLAASCVKLQRQPLDQHFYALEVTRPASAQAVVIPTVSPTTLLVRRLQAAPRTAGRELVYRTAPSAWSADYYNLFFVSPADMLTQDLRAWLTSACVFANVVGPGSLAESGYILEGNVSALHGDFAVQPAQAVAEMQFILFKSTGEERQVVFTREYSRRVALAANSPQELVRAQREAVAGIYADLEADLRAALTRKQP